jgi:hypothetical protein
MSQHTHSSRHVLHLGARIIRTGLSYPGGRRQVEGCGFRTPGIGLQAAGSRCRGTGIGLSCPDGRRQEGCGFRTPGIGLQAVLGYGHRGEA